MTHNDLIRRAGEDEREAVAACVDAAYAKYVPRMGKKPAPMLGDYGALIASGVVYVIADPPEVRGVVVLFPADGAMFLDHGRDILRHSAEQAGVVQMRSKISHRLRQDFIAAIVQHRLVERLVGAVRRNVVSRTAAQPFPLQRV